MNQTEHKPYEGRAPHQKHSLSSQDAAERIQPEVPSLQERVLIYLESTGVGGATDEEIQLALNMPVSTQVPRRRELQLDGKVHDSGKMRRTSNDRWAVVWVAGPPKVVPFKPKKMSRVQLMSYIRELEDQTTVLEEENMKMRKALVKYENRHRQSKLF
jgi:hypothetical protein